MNPATSKIRQLAKRLIAYEALRGRSPRQNVPMAFPVCDRLSRRLATMIGIVGSRALLSRTLVLGTAEVAWLHAVRVNAEGTLEALEPLPGPDELLAGRTALLAQLLGLLVAFIGPGLTARLVGETWPSFPLNEVDFGNGDKK